MKEDDEIFAVFSFGKKEVIGLTDTVKLLNKYLETSSIVYKKGIDLETHLEDLKGTIDINTQNIEINKTNISTIKANNILWDDYYHMTANHTAYLTQKVSEQTNGIVLVWCGYANGKPQDWNFIFTFIPKIFVALKPSGGIYCTMGGTEGVVGMKYVYIYDDRIEGHAKNADGDNARFVLRYVIGV